LKENLFPLAKNKKNPHKKHSDIFLNMVIRFLLAFFVLAFPIITLAFSDVPDSHKNAEAIDYIAEEEIISGFSDGTFQPEKQISRAAFTKIVVLASTPESEIQNCTQTYARPQMSIVFFSDVKKRRLVCAICLCCRNK
jgi:hypothetical protein